MSDSKRKFFAGNSMEQAVMMAARHYGLEPDELNYKEVQKRHGFVNTRRRFVISVDADVPRAPRDQIEAEALLREKERREAEAAKGRRRGGGNNRGRQGGPARQRGGSGAPKTARGGDRRPSRKDDQGARSKGRSSAGGRNAGRKEDRRHPARGRGGKKPQGRGGETKRPERAPKTEARQDRKGQMPDPPAPEPVVAPEAGETGWWFARPVRGDAGPSDTGPNESGRPKVSRGDTRSSRDSEDSRSEPVRRERKDQGGRKPSKARGRGRRPRGRERKEEDVPRQPASGPMADAAEEAIELLLDFAELDVDPKIFETPKRLEIDLAGPDDEVVTADNGKVLLALEHLMPRVLRGIHGETTAVRVDCAGYHRRREARLEEMAIAAADRVISSGRPQTLEEMDPAERRIVHMAVADEDGVETISVGDGFFKRVKIRPA